MFFSSAPLVSVSLAGIMFPTALGVPSVSLRCPFVRRRCLPFSSTTARWTSYVLPLQIVDIDARGGGTLTVTQTAMVSKAVGVVGAANGAYTTALKIGKGNNAEIVQNLLSVLHCVLPPGGILSTADLLNGGGGVLFVSGLLGSSRAFTGLLDPLTGLFGGLIGGCLTNGNLLSAGGPSSLLGLLGGLLVTNPLLSSLDTLVNTLVGLVNSGACNQDDAHALIAKIVALLTQVVGELNLGLECSPCTTGTAGTALVGALNGPLGALSVPL
ncbi:hypothetical protein B0H16DRAFT_1836776 [Mycena metata]|uniref:Uncharacterized protein n=1 Tax=Mycena metata TaxID=1033252 RepID=A0AAD7N9N2_9AGAR|nr:hypothetical protein B0H16DRAFT_1836776 [Mycena metata]